MSYRKNSGGCESGMEEGYTSRAVRLSDVNIKKISKVEQVQKTEHAPMGECSEAVGYGATKKTRSTHKIKPPMSQHSDMGEPCNVYVYSIEVYAAEDIVSVGCELTFDGEKSTEKIKIAISIRQYKELKIQKGEMDIECYRDLCEAGNLYAAIKQGSTFLSYGDRSKKMLKIKLVRKGYSQDIASRATDYFEENGFLREDDGAERLALLCTKKYWGKMRIKSELIAKGYGDDAVHAAMESLDGVDFDALCLELIKKKYRNAENTPEARKKLAAALSRYGYGYREISFAISEFFNKKD